MDEVYLVEKVGAYFTVTDVTRSQWASDHNVDNSIPEELLKNAERVATQVIDRIISELDINVLINSWYRNATVNAGVGGSQNPLSAHCDGRAVDLYITNKDIHAAFDAIKASDIQFDKMIIERNKRGSQWIHVQVRKDGSPARRITLQADYNHESGKMEYKPA